MLHFLRLVDKGITDAESVLDGLGPLGDRNEEISSSHLWRLEASQQKDNATFLWALKSAAEPLPYWVLQYAKGPVASVVANFEALLYAAFPDKQYVYALDMNRVLFNDEHRQVVRHLTLPLAGYMLALDQDIQSARSGSRGYFVEQVQNALTGSVGGWSIARYIEQANEKARAAEHVGNDKERLFWQGDLEQNVAAQRFWSELIASPHLEQFFAGAVKYTEADYTAQWNALIARVFHAGP